jgi:hypothetical protein
MTFRLIEDENEAPADQEPFLLITTGIRRIYLDSQAGSCQLSAGQITFPQDIIGIVLKTQEVGQWQENWS